MKQVSQLSYHVIGGDYAVERMFDDKGATKAPMLKADIVVFTGGADVSPDLYGDKKHPLTATNPRRDEYEFSCFKATKDKLRVGICRGGQFLNVMNGGWLWQHIDKHALRGTHPCTYEFVDPTLDRLVKRTVPVTSTHHQQIMVNKKANPQIWGWANECTWKETGNRMDMGVGAPVRMAVDTRKNVDVEIVFYPHTQSLCFQPHPEYSSLDTRHLFFECIERALNIAA